MSQAIAYQALDHYQVLRISGADSHKFLQGQLTCDLNDVNGEQAVLGGYCNVQGRLHATFYILKASHDYLMILPTGVAQHLLETLSKYAVFFQTELSLEPNMALLAIKPSSEAPHLSQISLDEFGAQKLVIGNLELVVLPKLHLADFMADELSQAQTATLDLMGLEQIEQGIPMVETVTIESLLPHYIGLAQNGGVNFEKGCYTGQEVVARMHYRGTLKTHPQLASIKTQEPLAAGSEILNGDDKKVGELINSAFDGEQLKAIISLADKALDSELSCHGAAVSILA
ncbi:MAG: folate-binding protein YgfZ [Gammaproteobacteria bacterium]|nr:folate-binding protein YgfZ [Gammaproteobacteria bacterium]